MNKKQYNNIIKHTLENEIKNSDSDNLENIRKIFKNMGVALPVGNLKEVNEALKSEDFMGWRSCTAEEAKAAANNGTAAIGISDTKISLLAADEMSNSNHALEIAVQEGREKLDYYLYSLDCTDVININGWLTLYSSSSLGGRRVNIPSGCNRKKWYAFEGLSTINYYARLAIKNSNYVYKGNKGELFDKEGRYWVAVGPKVMNPSHSNSAAVTASEMKYGTRIEVKLKHDNGNYYFLRAIVGDCKNHTYSNGIYQTGYSFPNGNEYYPQNADGSVIEFCGAVLSAGLNQFSIDSITVEN